MGLGFSNVSGQKHWNHSLVRQCPEMLRNLEMAGGYTIALLVRCLMLLYSMILGSPVMCLKLLY